MLNAAGYDQDGHHPDGRRLVFIGDLVDRGPDSPGVVAMVQRLVQSGRADAILGNHELNLLRGERKAGNDWFWCEGAHHDIRYEPYSQSVPPASEATLSFFGSLPLALVREDIRIVHAAWHAPSVAQLLALPADAEFGELFTALDAQAEHAVEIAGLAARAREEKAAWRHHFADPGVAMPMLTAVGQLDQDRQMLNPIRVLTSGLERCATRPFFASGQWRFAERVRWWNEYDDEVPVVVGHYWRQFVPLDRSALGKGDPDLFSGVPPAAWLGRLGNVYCVDFSVGGRYQERSASVAERRTRLAALRWPERTLVLETGEIVDTVGFGGKST